MYISTLSNIADTEILSVLSHNSLILKYHRLKLDNIALNTSKLLTVLPLVFTNYNLFLRSREKAV